MRTKYFIIATLLLTAIGVGSCKKSSTNPTVPVVTFLATLNGASETPPNASTATGSATLTYDPTTYTLSGSVTYSGITPTAAHIHMGAVGVAGGVIFPLGSAPYTSPIGVNVVLTVAQQSDLYAGSYYVNVHSVAFPNGEIRGQLIKQ